MEIVIIGTGNTATVLGRKLKSAGHRIVQVFGRNSSAASRLAYELGTQSTNYWNVVYREADLYILAVSDTAIGEVLEELRLPGKTMVHTAASVPMAIFKNTTDHYGVFYPLQSLKKETGVLPPIPVIIDAGDEATFKLLDHLAHTISPQVVRADDEQRLKLHVAAVFCNNFVNHLYALAESYCKREGIDFRLLLPLIRETADRLTDMSPAQSQTGPAVRNDQDTINRHLRLLENYPELKKVYALFTENIFLDR